MSSFWHGKRVLLTGHTGFKGSWMALWLKQLGAEVYGFALEPDTDPDLFHQLDLEVGIQHVIGDIRKVDLVEGYVFDVRPDIVFHFAAQSLVLRSYTETLETWQTNVQGTANLLQALRKAATPTSVVVVTTDKVYKNNETQHAYTEADRLGGIDPYSASKAASELVIDSFRSLYEQEALPLTLASARAGNVIGGGDWSDNRILPDIVRALSKGDPVKTRNPGAVRPWQHVLEPLSGYLKLAEQMHSDGSLAQAFNFGPNPSGNRTVADVVDAALKVWPGEYYVSTDHQAPHEAGLLKLSIDKAVEKLGWYPKWSFESSVARTVNWYKMVHKGASPLEMTLQDIQAYNAQCN